jgi:hypothetical protein
MEYFRQLGNQIIPLTAEEIAQRQVEEALSQNTVLYEPVNPEMNALIDAVIDLDSRLSVLEGGI